ncbi:MAG: hypothetical protein WB392_09465 [Methanotrichaceae archaeon]
MRGIAPRSKVFCAANGQSAFLYTQDLRSLRTYILQNPSTRVLFRLHMAYIHLSISQEIL